MSSFEIARARLAAAERRPTAVTVAPVEYVVSTDVHAVMREQLEFLISHAEAGICDCSQCARYERARQVLLEIFR